MTGVMSWLYKCHVNPNAHPFKYSVTHIFPFVILPILLCLKTVFIMAVTFVKGKDLTEP